MAKVWSRNVTSSIRRGFRGLQSNTEAANSSRLMSFDDCRLAYRSKTSRELLRSLLVLGFCKREFLVDHSEKLIKIGKRVLGVNLFNKVMKASFFGQFVAGENEEEIKPFILRLRKSFGVNVILNYAVEDDEQGGEQEKCGLIQHDDTSGKSVRQDRRDQIMMAFMKTIDQVEKTTACDGFAAIKVTALAKSETLITITNIVEKWGCDHNCVVDSQSVGEDLLSQLPARTNRNISSPQTLDVQYTDLMSLIRRMETIAKHAEERNVRVLVDAEQTYFQPGIARLSLELMRKYNLRKPTIFNTYQCYLKRTLKDMTEHLALSKKEGFHFGGKIVRGAYIVLERERALSMGYPDPINPTFEATTAMYKSVVGTLLEDMKREGKAGKTHIVIAGHNEETIQWAVSEIHRLQIPVESRHLYFGQLLGMCDHLSFTLADVGFNVVKCVPYGSVDEVLPYLVRRAQENRGFLEKTTTERRLMWQEFKRRLKTGELMHNPDDHNAESLKV